MSVQRVINSKFWSDSFVVDKLNPLDRYLFLYLLTNEKTNLSGVYELPLRTIANETGLEKEEVLRMMERLRGKVEYKDGWICLVNFTKHQNTENGSIAKGIENRLSELPLEVRKWVDKLRKKTSGIPVVDETSTSGEQPNLTKPNLTKPNSEDASQEIPILIKSFECINPVAKNWYGNKTQRKACQDLIDTYSFERVKNVIENTLPKTNKIQYFPTITTPLQLRDKWTALESAIIKLQSEKINKENKYKVAFTS